MASCGTTDGAAGNSQALRIGAGIGEPSQADLAVAERLGQAVRFKTISFDNPEYVNREPFRDFHVFLEKSYPKTHEVLTRTNVFRDALLYEWRGSDPDLPPVILLAHQDVVPIEHETISLWSHDPFSGEIEDGYVWGRGSLDMKGQLMGIFEAVERLIGEGHTPRQTVLIALGDDEETYGEGAQALAAHIKEHYSRADFLLDEGGVILSPFPVTEKPAAFIGIAEKGYGSIRVQARGTAGHSAIPSSDLAVNKLARALTEIEDLKPERQLDPITKEMFRALSKDFGFFSRLAIRNTWLLGSLLSDALIVEPGGKAILGTTIAPTMLSASPKENVLPEFAEAIINIRIHPRETPDDVLKTIRGAIDGIDGVSAEWFIEPTPAVAPSSTQSRGYKMIAEGLRAISHPDVSVAPLLIFGATDSRFYTEVAKDIYRVQPIVISVEEMSLTHGIDERISIENLKRIIRFYEGLLSKL